MGAQTPRFRPDDVVLCGMRGRQLAAVVLGCIGLIAIAMFSSRQVPTEASASDGGAAAGVVSGVASGVAYMMGARPIVNAQLRAHEVAQYSGL